MSLDDFRARRAMEAAVQACSQEGHDALVDGRCVRCKREPVAGFTAAELADFDRRARDHAARGPSKPQLVHGGHDATMRQVRGFHAPGSGLPAWHDNRRLEHLRRDWLVHPSQEPALERCERWVAQQRTVNPQRKGLLLLGPVGSGKTSLLAAGAVMLGEPDNGVLFRAVRELYRQSKEAMRTGDVDPFTVAAKTRLLFLDDLGAVADTGWRVDELRTLIDARFDNGLVTCATSNLTTAELGGLLGERSFSRLVSTVEVVGVAGPDHRRTA